MPEVVTTASGSSVRDAESSLESIDHIIKREFSGIFDICKIARFKKNLKGNTEKLKNAPTMVKQFCQEVKVIIVEMSEVLGDKTDDEDDKDSDTDNKAPAADADDEDGKTQSTETKEREDEDKDEDKDEDETVASGGSTAQKKKEKKENDKKSKKDEKKKKDYHKQLKMETVGLGDIDKLFTDLGTSLNKFIATREKMQQARESFEKIIKTICNFDGKKELKAYIKELKEKAKEGNMQIYIDTSNGEIKLDSVKGVDPPAPYRNAVKALNDIKASGKETLDLEPVVERGIESCARDITKIEPLKDFKKLVSGFKETMALPKKVKAFNENAKKVQQAPQIVKELCLYVKQILEDIVNAFKEDDKTKEKNEETEEKDDDAKEDKIAGGNDKKENTVEATIHAPGKYTKTEKVEENNSMVVC